MINFAILEFGQEMSMRDNVKSFTKLSNIKSTDRLLGNSSMTSFAGYRLTSRPIRYS